MTMTQTEKKISDIYFDMFGSDLEATELKPLTTLSEEGLYNAADNGDISFGERDVALYVRFNERL